MKGYQLIRDMKDRHMNLGKNVLFTPHVNFKREQYAFRWFPESDCINDGNYCVQIFDPSINATGKALIEEAVRQMCIYQLEKDKKGAYKFFDYMSNMPDTCMGQFTSECSAKVQNKVGISKKDVNKCYEGNFTSILEREFNSSLSAGVYYTPAVVVNNVSLRGTLDVNSIFGAICVGFNMTPSVCKTLGEKSPIPWGTVLLILFVVSAASIVSIYYCVNKSKKEFQDQLDLQVSAAVTHYMALKDQNRGQIANL